MSISTKTANPQKSSFSRAAGFALALTFFLTLAPINSAIALSVDLKKIPAVRVYEEASPEQFKKTTEVIKDEKPYGDKLVGYEFRVPKGWSKNLQPPTAVLADNHKLGGNVLDILGRYIGPPTNLHRSYLVVEAQAMKYEIGAQHWFVNFIVSNGFSLSSLTEHDARKLDAVYVAVEKDKPYVVRARVLVNGARLILARYYLPQENYQEEAIQQSQVMDSFALVNPTQDRIEKQDEYGFLDQSYFNYPDSWTLRSREILSIERMSAEIFQKSMEEDSRRANLEGYIKINAISRLLNTTLAQEVDKFRKGINVKGYKLGTLLEEVTYKYSSSIKSGKAQIYKLMPDDPVRMQPYEYLVTVMTGDDYYYITSMITPSREIDFYKWARNMEAMRIVNESLRRTNMVLDYDANDPYFDYLKKQ
ncbi:MAG: hypothetical protein DI626_06915 [Micavibrio aeruginosavorus]|uniref:Uncharacterized protein n=1 Tax=Micavibrio aeruginosavorus TaxID=349221 RepID=A0A2W5BSE6_9BACT|nr:MAG: hypothetical protein DI626_06915 [Micavibrio aeruginosavorus]